MTQSSASIFDASIRRLIRYNLRHGSHAQKPPRPPCLLKQLLEQMLSARELDKGNGQNPMRGAPATATSVEDYETLMLAHIVSLIAPLIFEYVGSWSAYKKPASGGLDSWNFSWTTCCEL